MEYAMNLGFDHETHEQHEKEPKILYKEECYGIQGAVFEVYREMGCGFLEAVYQECTQPNFCSAISLLWPNLNWPSCTKALY